MGEGYHVLRGVAVAETPDARSLLAERAGIPTDVHDVDGRPSVDLPLGVFVGKLAREGLETLFPPGFHGLPFALHEVRLAHRRHPLRQAEFL